MVFFYFLDADLDAAVPSYETLVNETVTNVSFFLDGLDAWISIRLVLWTRKNSVQNWEKGDAIHYKKKFFTIIISCLRWGTCQLG
ncbi:hypothetical protein RCL_jg23077.t1 [Rhizophagus clarus]|uniref:Uncharacterized protein n=1 Tax=Rhizophagus clarus TaxID=94130 RepID=A0A8H3L3U1_9GLOM|nr:hypothetical protein RCL_jg23077.t1 [Rhizophagus clarus]